MEAEATQTKGWELDLVNASFLTGIPILAAIGMVVHHEPRYFNG